VQGRLRDAGLGGDYSEGAALGLEETRVLDLVGWVGDGAADVPVTGFGHGTGVGSVLGGEGAFHLGEQRQEQEGDAPAASRVAPCAFAAVRDITGRMLLVRRCDTGDWELPGGHVDPGESASDAAVRETAEESGITVEVTGLVGIYTDPGHVIADPRAGLVRQPFAVCFHAAR
jgi:hypothetical protein